MRALLLSGALACLLVSATPRAEPAGLGSLESEALATALSSRGLVEDPAPQGKTVGQIHVVNLDVFQPGEGRLLSFFNYFHLTSREHHVRRESLLTSGMPYDQSVVDETVRNLRTKSTTATDDPMLSSVVVMVPVVAAEPGTVDLLIVTRDLWSLRFNTDYEFQKASLLRLTTSISENNFLGRRKHLSMVFDLEQGYANIGPNYYDPNVLGTRVRLNAALYGSWERKIDQIALGGREGSAGRLKVEYPLFSLASKHGAFVDGYYRKGVDRLFREAQLGVIHPTVDRACSGPSDVPDPQALPCAFRSFSTNLTSGYTRSFQGPAVIQRVGVGHDLGVRRVDFLPGFPEDPAMRDAFASKVIGPGYRLSGVYLAYNVFTPRYRVMRDLDTYDLGEDYREGPNLWVKLGRTEQFLGSDFASTYFAGDLHINGDVLGGFQNLGVSWDGRLYDLTMRDVLVKGYGRVASPVLGRVARIVLDGSVGMFWDNRFHPRFIVGGTEGLRGYPVGAFYGDANKGADSAYYLTHLEVRSAPLSLGFLRWGGLFFADAGHVAPRVGALAFYPDVGLGLRVLIPQFNAEVLRFDWAMPLRAYAFGGNPPVIIPAGWRGQRLSLGFRQAF